MKKPTTKSPAPSKGAIAVSNKSTAVAAASDEFDSGKNTPDGFENVTTQDLIIPRLTILQSLSPQLNKKKAEYIEGSKPGLFCDVAVGQVWSQIVFLPCFFARVYLEWAPRDTGKGLIRNYGTDSSIMDQTTRDEKNRAILPNGNYIAETATYFGLNMSAGGRQSFLPLSSTGLSASRRWMMKMKAERLQRADGSEYEPPIYYRSWIASVTEETKNKDDWFGWSFEPGKTILELDPSKQLLQQAKQFYMQAREGLVRGDVEGAANEDMANSGHSEDRAM